MSAGDVDRRLARTAAAQRATELQLQRAADALVRATELLARARHGQSQGGVDRGRDDGSGPADERRGATAPRG